MSAHLHGFLPDGKTSPFAPGPEGLFNLQFDADDEAANATRGFRRPPGQNTRPPGGAVLVVAALSAASGAMMGMVFAGYLTLAAVLVASLVAGIAIGFWVARLGA